MREGWPGRSDWPNGQNTERLVGIVHRHPLCVRLRCLAADRASVDSGQCGQGYCQVEIERGEAVQAFVVFQTALAARRRVPGHSSQTDRGRTCAAPIARRQPKPGR